jgi:alpha-soluble NSF attachment protein
MGDYTAKGKALMEKADKKLSSWSMFGNKYEDAAELIEKACNQFKLGKACNRPHVRFLP